MKKSPWNKFLFLLMTVLLTCGGGLFLLQEPPPPPFPEVRRTHASSDWTLLDRQGRVLHQTRVNFRHRKLTWISLEEMSPLFIQTLLQSEDKRFYGHSGVDWRSLLQNAGLALLGKARSGGSTLTMQLAGLLNSSLNARKGPRSLWQKFRQIEAALALEKRWSKKQILEAYLNLVGFRGELQGLHAASWGIWKKNPMALDQFEAKALVALLRGPNASAIRVFQRIVRMGPNPTPEWDKEKKFPQLTEALTPPYEIPRPPQLALHAGRRIWNQKSLSPEKNFTLHSTLDLPLQKAALTFLKQHLIQLAPQNVRDGALLVVENKTGKVLAYVGNGGIHSSFPHVDGVMSRRLSGSTLKPFLFALGIEKKILAASSLLLDSPVNLSFPNGMFSPQNYDRNYRGRVTVRQALASSLNIPAIRALHLVGQDAFLQKLRDLGISGSEGNVLKDADYYGPAMALGTVESNLWELVNAYRTLANGGISSPLYMDKNKKTLAAPRTLFSRGTSAIITHILADREAREMTFSLESPLNTSFFTAVKTGTSKDMRDNWCIGFSSHYTVGVWVGNFSGEPMWNVSGVSGAAPLWAVLMKILHQNLQSPRPLPPPEEVEIKRISLGRKNYEELFLKGTAPYGGHIQSVSRQAFPKILYPPEGLVVAMDPDIPRNQQKMIFQSNQISPTPLLWSLDGKILGLADKAVLWSPKKGTHTLALQGEGEKILNKVSFIIK